MRYIYVEEEFESEQEDFEEDQDPLKMRARKRGGCDLTRSSIDSKRTCCGAREITKSFVSGDLDGGSDQVLSNLGEELALKLSKSVVSLALSVGHKMIFACSGIAIECNSHATRLLTSGTLVRALNNEAKDHDNVKIEVRHEGNVVIGLLEEYDLNLDFSIVKVTSFLDVDAVFLNRALQFMPHCKVVSLGRDVSGKLMAKSGKLSSDWIGPDDSEDLMFSSCKLSEIWEGGALFDVVGNFAGMNVVPSMERSLFLPKSLIIQRLQHVSTSQELIAFQRLVKKLKMPRVGEGSDPEVHTGAPDKDLHGDLEASGHPSHSKSGMVLVNEDPFGDVNHRCVWRQLDKKVCKMLKRNVVSLASFKGDTMFFACSGFVIEWDDECGRDGHQIILTSARLVRNPEYPFDDGNKIADGLRIEVVLPKKRRREGTLIHYCLFYNVALVSVRKSCSVSPAILRHGKINQSSKLVSVGRCFKSGDLMASTGKLAGIGGPLIDVDGHYIGMNYDSELGTPFLFSDDFVVALDCFKERVRERLTDGTAYSHAELHGDAPNKDRHEDQASDYPMAYGSAMNFIDTFAKRMTLIDAFTEPFGDVYRRCAWRQLEKGVSEMIKQNVVSLASFKGDAMFFACSGCVIDWDDGCGDDGRQIILTSASLIRNPEYPFHDGDKIADGLRIEVALPNKKRREGTVIRYNLHYNVILVSVKEVFSASPAAVLCKREVHKKVNHSSRLVALGRTFNSGHLMASSGKLVHWSGPFDCKKLRYSSCRISKVGIGGPLFDVHGNYMGMNFYDPKVGTPVLFCDDIVTILDCFKKRSGADADNFRISRDHSVCLNMWTVNDSDGDFKYEREVARGCKFKYLRGKIWHCN
ncbi:hypothetical protein EJB05_43603 [Eragrostis curvula]|uniref:Uncharacterized protein n=1 Tax=Eragrostis curvula TaxID=38414 RepID=A0A5J9TFL0_9POAL|nr:hypothetical protein EJB05_43603 [Eragrostis curvula]